MNISTAAHNRWLRANVAGFHKMCETHHCGCPRDLATYPGGLLSHAVPDVNLRL